MARTEIYTIRKKDCRMEHFRDVAQAGAGAMLIWDVLEKRYLPSLPLEDWMKGLGWDYYSRFLSHKKELMDEFWELERDPRLTWQERIVLSSTYDFAVIRFDDLPEVADAYEQVDFASNNMKQQAQAFRDIYASKDKSIAAVYKLETSVCCLGDFAHQKRSGYCYMTDKFYDVMAYLRDLKSVNYDLDKYFELHKK